MNYEFFAHVVVRLTVLSGTEATVYYRIIMTFDLCTLPVYFVIFWSFACIAFILHLRQEDLDWQLIE